MGEGTDDLGRILVQGEEVLAHVVVRSFVGAAEKGHHVADVDRFLRLDGEGEFFHVHVKAEGRCQVTEDEILTDLVVASLGAGNVVGFPENQVSFAVPQAELAGDGLHIVGAHEIVFVLPVDLPDPGNVGGNGDFVVRNSLGGPYGARPSLPGPEDFEEPGFLLVRDGQAFAGIAVSVFLGDGTHQSDGVPGVVAAHQGEPGQFLYQEHAVGVLEGIGTTEGRFTDGELLLVQRGITGIDISIGAPGLRNLADNLYACGITAEFRMAGPFADLEGLAPFVAGGGFQGDPGMGNAVAGV